MRIHISAAAWRLLRLSMATAVLYIQPKSYKLLVAYATIDFVSLAAVLQAGSLSMLEYPFLLAYPSPGYPKSLLSIHDDLYVCTFV
jgi:hypothetical protein